MKPFSSAKCARIGALWKRFRRNTSGSLSVEAVLIFPILFWAYMGTYVYFDAYRSKATNVKAAFTISDAITRETGYMTPDYLNSLWRLHRFLTTSLTDTKLRVTAIRYDGINNTYDVRWSRDKGGMGVLDTAGLRANYVDRLPIVAHWKYIIMVETKVSYTPLFNVGLAPFTYENTVMTVPRFASKLCWNDTPSNPDKEIC